MKIRTLASTGIAAGVVAALVSLAGPASADPPADGYSAVGSDTIQDVVNALVNGTSVTGSNVRITSKGLAVGSFNAFGSPTIQPKVSSVFFTRPSGSGAGIAALNASINGQPYGGSANPTTGADQAISGLVDIARSSSAPSSTGTTLAFVPFARDLVEYAYKVPSTASTTCITNLGALTAAQLKAIYQATAATDISGCDSPITPRLPQVNSGTRKFFLGAIGVTEANKGSAVPDTTSTTVPEENTGGQIADWQIIPFSAAGWIAQSTGAAPNTISADADLHLGAVNGIAAISGTGRNTQGVAAAFNNATFGRDTYLVVENARITPSNAKYDAALAALVNDTASSGSLTTFSSTLPNSAGGVKLKFGFQKPSTTAISYGNS